MKADGRRVVTPLTGTQWMIHTLPSVPTSSETGRTNESLS
jgi:hypothetical protein